MDMKTVNTVLEPQSRHDYTVWRSMDRAPKTGYPIQHVQLLLDGGVIVKDAHWADGGGEDQPRFLGWFVPVKRENGTVSYFSEVPGEPRAWAPMP